VAVWLLVLSGPAALVWQATSQQNGTAPVAASVAATDPGPRSAVAAFAEDVAVRWLSATTGPAADPAADPADSAGGTTAATNAATVDITAPVWPAESGPQLWSVLVAVAGTAAAASPTYVQVPLVVDAADNPGELPSIAPFGDPAIVPGPAEAVLGQPSAYSAVLPLSDPRAVSAAAFVTALLTGGDVTPLTSPGVTIRAVQPPPAGAVEIRSVVSTSKEDTERAELALTVALTPALDPGAPGPVDVTTTRTATYYLALTARDGRWEIAALRPGPLVTASPDASQSDASQSDASQSDASQSDTSPAPADR